jgi:hypothetical protein
METRTDCQTQTLLLDVEGDVSDDQLFRLVEGGWMKALLINHGDKFLGLPYDMSWRRVGSSDEMAAVDIVHDDCKACRASILLGAHEWERAAKAGRNVIGFVVNFKIDTVIDGDASVDAYAGPIGAHVG